MVFSFFLTINLNTWNLSLRKMNEYQFYCLFDPSYLGYMIMEKRVPEFFLSLSFFSYFSSSFLLSSKSPSVTTGRLELFKLFSFLLKFLFGNLSSFKSKSILFQFLSLNSFYFDILLTVARFTFIKSSSSYSYWRTFERSPKSEYFNTLYFPLESRRSLCKMILEDLIISLFFRFYSSKTTSWTL